MKLERAANLLSILPVVQQAVGLIEIISGIAKICFNLLICATTSYSLKKDFRLIAKGVVRSIPIIGTIFSAILTFKPPLSSLSIEDLIKIIDKEGLRDLGSRGAVDLGTLNRSINTLTAHVDDWGLYVTVHPDFLKHSPLVVLDKIAEALEGKQLSNVGTQTKISFLNDKGVKKATDAGGPSAQFLNSLITSAAPLLCNDKGMPIAKTEEDKTRLQAFAYLLASAARHNKPVAKCLPSSFFDLLVASKELKSENTELKQIELYIKILEDIHGTDHEIVRKHRILLLLTQDPNELSDDSLDYLAGIVFLWENKPDWWGEDDELPEVEVLRKNATELRKLVAKKYCTDESLTENDNYLTPKNVLEFLTQEVQKDGQAPAILIIAETLFSYELKNLTPKELELAIHGTTLTIKEIKDAFLRGYGDDDLKRLLFIWLIENKNNPKIGDLIEALTGSRSLKEGKELDINSSNLNIGLISSIHTCSGNIELDKEHLKQMMAQMYYNGSQLKLSLLSIDDCYPVFKQSLEHSMEETLNSNYNAN